MKPNGQIWQVKTVSRDVGSMHSRLSSLKDETERIRILEPVESIQILKDRAKALALDDKSGVIEERITVLVFLLAYEHYAIEIEQVKEVSRIRELTLLPGIPSFVLGIINIRGEIFSVIDLKKILDIPDRGLPEFNSVIIMRDEKKRVGIVVDSVIGIRQIFKSALNPTPTTLTGNRAEFMKGVTADPIIVLDGAKILTDQGLIVNEQV